MDDIGRLSTDRETTQYGNDKLEEMVSSKGLEFNMSKSNFLIIGIIKFLIIFAILNIIIEF